MKQQLEEEIRNFIIPGRWVCIPSRRLSSNAGVTYRSLRSDFGTSFVKIIVGSKRKEFVTHKDLLCEKLEWSRKVIRKGSREIEGPTSHLST